MTATWRTVRVFTTSTFRDMQAERDHLGRFVSPRLRQELLQRRIRLVEVDLRWGVTSEHDTLSVCREVVDGCRPRVLCMLGGRYGWVPPGRIRLIPVHTGTLRPAHSACLDQPVSAFLDQPLLSERPRCHSPLKLNPFFVEVVDALT